jgi:hypothetical protein
MNKETIIKQAVDKFLPWKLPQHFHPDSFISFDGSKHDTWGGYPNSWPTGTNLFSSEQAKAMFEYCLSDTVEAMAAELEAAKAEYEQSMHHQNVQYKFRVAERDALESKLSAIQTQEPVAWMDCFGNVNRVKYRGFNTPLYAIPQVEQHASDDELHGMWSNSDFTGGSTECNAQPVAPHQDIDYWRKKYADLGLQYDKLIQAQPGALNDK